MWCPLTFLGSTDISFFGMFGCCFDLHRVDCVCWKSVMYLCVCVSGVSRGAIRETTLRSIDLEVSSHSGRADPRSLCLARLRAHAYQVELAAGDGRNSSSPKIQRSGLRHADDVGGHTRYRRRRAQPQPRLCDLRCYCTTKRPPPDATALCRKAHYYDTSRRSKHQILVPQIPVKCRVFARLDDLNQLPSWQITEKITARCSFTTLG